MMSCLLNSRDQNPINILISLLYLESQSMNWFLTLFLPLPTHCILTCRQFIVPEALVYKKTKVVCMKESIYYWLLFTTSMLQ